MKIIFPILLFIVLYGYNRQEGSDNFSFKSVISDTPETEEVMPGTVPGNGVKYDNFVDSRDGKIYRTINIGQQVWMAENLNYDAGEGCWIYENKPENAVIYGRLYNWETANRSCPAGWHLPSGVDWNLLKESLGGNNLAGGRMKASGTDLWRYPNVTSELLSGFSALPGGYYDKKGFFRFKGYACIFWSAKVMSEISSNFVILFLNNDFFDDHGRSDMKTGFSVRCVMD